MWVEEKTQVQTDKLWKKRFSWNWFHSHEDGKKTALLNRKAKCFPGSLQSRSTGLLSWYSKGSIFFLPPLRCWLMPEDRAPSSVCQRSCSASPSQRRSGRQPLPSCSSQRTGLLPDKFSVSKCGHQHLQWCLQVKLLSSAGQLLPREAQFLKGYHRVSSPLVQPVGRERWTLWSGFLQLGI